jgi:hypothetical protein
MKMVEYRVVSCIGQIIIDTDIALLLLVIFIQDEYRTSSAILVSHGSIKNPDYLEWTCYTPPPRFCDPGLVEYFRNISNRMVYSESNASFLSPAGCPNPKVYVEPWISLIDTSTLS